MLREVEVGWAGSKWELCTFCSVQVCCESLNCSKKTTTIFLRKVFILLSVLNGNSMYTSTEKMGKIVEEEVKSPVARKGNG